MPDHYLSPGSDSPFAGLTRDAAIEAFVTYADDPRWTAVRQRGFDLHNDMTGFRRSYPLFHMDGVGYENEPHLIMDATPDVTNDRPFSILTIRNDLPAYASLRPIRKIPGDFIPQAGRWYQFDMAMASAALHGGQGQQTLGSLKRYIALRGGRFHFFNRRLALEDSVLPVTIVKAGDDAMMERSCHTVSAAALAYRYFASMEMPLANGTSVALPLSLGQVREVLRDRDKPESGSRRAALLHLVRSHNRKLDDGDVARVREHLRGKEVCHWRGWDVIVRPSDFDAERIKKP